MTKVRSRIATDIDFERPGKQTGYLMLPFSRPDSAYGRILMPVIVIANGTGPTALLIAGNHGDEFEGQIALAKLARDLAPDRVHGRVIILPAANLPAAEAGNRNSPLDSGNLNREFPGDPDGGPTQMIAHFIESVLLPMADYAVDLHSGGVSLVYSPCALVRESGPVDRIVRTMAAQDAFGAPLIRSRPITGRRVVDSLNLSSCRPGKRRLCVDGARRITNLNQFFWRSYAFEPVAGRTRLCHASEPCRPSGGRSTAFRQSGASSRLHGAAAECGCAGPSRQASPRSGDGLRPEIGRASWRETV